MPLEIECIDCLACMRHDISNQPLEVLVFIHNHNHLLHCWVALNDLLNLSQFHPMTADLALIVHSSQKFQVSIRQISCQISGAVESVSRRSVERISNKPFSG